MRLLHFSDLHLGAEIHGRKDPETGMHTQLKDFLRCMDFMVETALERDVDAVLFTGDAYHFRRPDPLPQREFIKRIKTLSDRGIAVLLWRETTTCHQVTVRHQPLTFSVC